MKNKTFSLGTPPHNPGRAPVGASISDVQVSGNKVTAVLSTRDATPRDLVVAALSADGDSAFLTVPVGRLLLLGRVLERPGDGSEKPLFQAFVKVVVEGQELVKVRKTDFQGQYLAQVDTGKPIEVTVEDPGYLSATVRLPPAKAGQTDTVLAPSIFMISLDECNLAQKRRPT